MTALDGILGALLGAPALPGARCRGRSHVFDPAAHDEDPEVVQQRHTQAVGLCERCPSLNACTDWVASLKPAQRPLGVVAGQVRRERVGRRAAS